MHTLATNASLHLCNYEYVTDVKDTFGRVSKTHTVAHGIGRETYRTGVEEKHGFWHSLGEVFAEECVVPIPIQQQRWSCVHIHV